MKYSSETSFQGFKSQVLFERVSENKGGKDFGEEEYILGFDLPAKQSIP